VGSGGSKAAKPCPFAMHALLFNQAPGSGCRSAPNFFTRCLGGIPASNKKAHGSSNRGRGHQSIEVCSGAAAPSLFGGQGAWRERRHGHRVSARKMLIGAKELPKLGGELVRTKVLGHANRRSIHPSAA